MGATTRRPHQALLPYVRALHAYDLDGFPPGDHIGLPSATVTLVIPVGQRLELTMAPAERRALGSCLAGMHDGPTTIHHDGTQRGLQLAVNPLGLHRLLGMPAAEVAGRAVELPDVLGDREAATLLDRVASERDPGARLRLVESSLLRRLDPLDRRPEVRPEVLRAWQVLARSHGTARVHAVAREVGWSTRHLAVQFTAALGATPKTVARLMRFQRSAALVGAGLSPADVAGRCGFADQAHMTREWMRMTGTTPVRWRRDDVLANVQDSGRPDVDDRRHDEPS